MCICTLSLVIASNDVYVTIFTLLKYIFVYLTVKLLTLTDSISVKVSFFVLSASCRLVSGPPPSQLGLQRSLSGST